MATWEKKFPELESCHRLDANQNYTFDDFRENPPAVVHHL